MSIASYPHVKIHVKDNSIYNAIATETLPLHKPLYMMRMQRGKVGVPVWCPAYSTAKKEFGVETFNPRTKYFSNQAYFLLKTFPRNGAFLMRVADTTCTTATITIEIGTKTGTIKQRLRDSNGRYVTDLDGTTTFINASGEAVGYATIDKYVQVPSGSMVEKDVVYYTDADNYVEGGTVGSGAQLAWADGDVYTKSGATYTKVDKTTTTTPAANTTYYVIDGKVKEQMYGLTPGALFPDGQTVYTKEVVITGEPENVATVDGIRIAWRARVRTAQESEEYALDEQKDTSTNDGWRWRTAFNVVADNPGAWGQAFGLKIFYDATANTVADTISYGSITTSFQPVELVAGDTLPTPIYDAYNQQSLSGTLKKSVIDPVTDLNLYLGKLIDRCYIGNHQLPIKVYPIPATFGQIGEEVMAAEIAARDTVTSLYADTYGINTADGEKVQTFVDALFEKTAIGTDVATTDTITEYDRNDEAFNEELNELNNGDMAIDNMFAGFMVNLFTLKDGNKVPYYAASLVTTDPLTWETDSEMSAYIKSGSDAQAQGVGIFTPGQDTAVYLAGGNDGNIKDWDIERFIQAHVRAAEAGTQEYLIDYARCPFNCFIDTGVSLATKKAYLDMLDVRDSLVVNLSTQVTWHYQKKVGTKKIETTPDLNTRYEDESIGSALRAYAWLMKEDIENGTECCRANIFLHSGKTSDYEGWVPGTLCIALKWADFYKGQYINQEVRELPNSDIDCFTEVSWAAAAEDTKARCWNAGLNYWQYYNMTRLHYASVHSVYRHDTSILSDSAVVYAICFCKDETRRSWARWAGSGRRAAELNQKITDDLDARFKVLLNGKYTCDPTVYQTDEDMKRGYSRHIDLRFEAPGQNRVWEVTVECNRENFNPSAE